MARLLATKGKSPGRYTVTIWLTNEEVRQVLTMEDCLKILDEAYYEHGAGRANNPPMINLVTPDDSPSEDSMQKFHWLRSMPGGVQKFGIAAIRINSYRVGFRETNGMKNKVRLPTAPGHQYTGMLLIFSVRTGEPLLMCPDGFLQRLRVGGTAGLGVKYLSREDSETVGLIGSGFQAETHLTATCALRPIKRIKVFSRDPDRRAKFAARMEKTLGVETVAVATPEAAVAKSDVVLTTTNSLKPVLKGEWLEEGMHVGSVLDLEIDVSALQRFDLIVASRRGMLWQDHTMGDPENDRPPEGNPHNLPHYNRLKEQRGRPEIPVDWDSVPTIGEVMVGKVKGRTSRSQISYFLNIGDGIQFAAVGAKLLEIVKEKKLGRELPFDLFHSQVDEWATLT